ncbi:hypothetical protein [Arenibacter sp. ARW7G5Y1]|uniref:hypothetical protein n=1 Tax=Arenibacter sp. ARW7G5Y1 TaxID=2135619 RepID=UPI000D75C023|nr:hypothetical protein [Arenibacter sp. ARW7G5Y1]PXX27270.1 hypothetical protein C7972_10754 [Arenibacter sp. ARW7G5Y1]
MADRKPKNKIVWIIAIAMALMLLLFAVLQFSAKRYVENLLNKKIPDHIHLVYDKIEVNLLTGSLLITDVTLDISNRNAGNEHTEMHLESISMEGFGYYNYILGNTIGADKIKLLNPKVRYYNDNTTNKITSDKPLETGTEKVFVLDHLEIEDGEIVNIQNETNTIKFTVENFNLSLENLQLDKETVTHKIPFSYGDYKLNTGKVYADLGPYEALSLSGTNIDKRVLQLSNLSLKSKYNKRTLSKKLDKEHDYIDLEIPKVRLVNMDFGFRAERFFLNTKSVVFQNPKMQIYRDKLVQDDYEQKKLYSQMLRELPIDLNISEVRIKDGYIAYSELVKTGTVPGEIVFSDLKASMSNVSNIYENEEKTEIMAKAKLMGEAPIELTWNFDSKEGNDPFFVSGVVTNFKSKSINQFLRSNLRAEAEGDVEELYFTLSGDAVSASGDMKMNYEDFRFTVLKKDRMGVNKLLTFVGNIFTNDGSKSDKMGYRYGEIYAERDKTKSFFNYLWLNVMDGMVNTLTGDGEKD